VSTLAILLALLPPVQDRKPDERITFPGLRTGETVTFDLVHVPGGTFKMGSPAAEPGRDADEEAVREVAIRSFWMAKREVTWAEYDTFYQTRKQAKVDGVTRPSEPYEPPGGEGATGAHPAVSMRYHGAMRYCDLLSKTVGGKYRLPTAAEWEYACRAGSDAPSPAPLGEFAFYDANSGGKPVLGGQKKPNAWGLHDLFGSVWEYCLEPYAPPAFGPLLKGGAWNSPAKELRAANRQSYQPDWFERDPNRPRSLWWLTDARFVGFRPVRVSTPDERKAEEAYFPKVGIGPLKTGDTSAGNIRVTGQVKNEGDRPLDEIELTVYYLDPKGQPLLEDRKYRPTFNKVYPVIVTSGLAPLHARPLKPGESREFELDVPQPFDYDVDLEKVGAAVTGLRFSN
jgi:formylglycine-generating enzyme required for sulfatase activity